MEEDKNRLLCHKGLSFFGTITASVTHEINNVFSIVNELSGLLEDMAMGAVPGRPVDPEKLKKISQNTARQVGRGVAIIKRLNRFAHSVDEPVASLDLNAFLDDITHLSQRFASLSKVSLSTQMPETSLTLTTRPFFLWHAVFICIRLAIAASLKEGNVDISCEKSQSHVDISISSGHIDETEEVSSRLAVVYLLLEELQGDVEIIDAEGHNGLKLTIPISGISKEI